MREQTIVFITLMASMMLLPAPQYSLYGQTQIGNTITGTEPDDGTGSTVSISDDGTRIAIGASRLDIQDSTNAGKVTVYGLVGGSWQQVGQPLLGEGQGQQLGRYMDLSDDGSRIVVSTFSSTRVYEFISGTWQIIGNESDFTHLSGRIRYQLNI